MEAHWWCCVLGLLCSMPAPVILSSSTVSQQPSSISTMTVNSSVEITCSSSGPKPKGFSLYRRFSDNWAIAFLSLKNGQVEKTTIAAEYTGRISVSPDPRQSGGCGFTLRLSLLGLHDTDLYYCSWSYFSADTNVAGQLSSNGTVIIVRVYTQYGQEVDEGGPQAQCDHLTSDFIYIALSVTAFTVVLLLLIIALIVRCRRFKRNFRPARRAPPPRPSRPPHACPRQTLQHCPYLITSVDGLDFRGIL